MLKDSYPRFKDMLPQETEALKCVLYLMQTYQRYYVRHDRRQQDEEPKDYMRRRLTMLVYIFETFLVNVDSLIRVPNSYFSESAEKAVATCDHISRLADQMAAIIAADDYKLEHADFEFEVSEYTASYYKEKAQAARVRILEYFDGEESNNCLF